jgi:transportin-3
MASKEGAAGQAFGPVLAAVATMQGNVSRSEKTHAHEFLEKFQKSIEAWSITHNLLQSPDVPVEAKLFAATTLKGKVQQPMPWSSGNVMHRNADLSRSYSI